MHWHEGDSGVCLTYSNENVSVEACLYSEGSNPSETMKKSKTTDLKTPNEKEKPMINSLKTTILRWAKATVITVSLGIVGEISLQPNAL
ncbi:MAG: hypothetical protein ACRCYW_14415 [Aeromonas sp.]|uniref:hypothetical protein n=1 Tax=Aeromonas sp. TaxID=647 RepID=UPI003F3D4BE1